MCVCYHQQCVNITRELCCCRCYSSTPTATPPNQVQTFSFEKRRSFKFAICKSSLFNSNCKWTSKIFNYNINICKYMSELYICKTDWFTIYTIHTPCICTRTHEHLIVYTIYFYYWLFSKNSHFTVVWNYIFNRLIIPKNWKSRSADKLFQLTVNAQIQHYLLTIII